MDSDDRARPWLSDRTCGLCGIRDIPGGMNWRWWTDGKPVHMVCQLTRRPAEEMESVPESINIASVPQDMELQVIATAVDALEQVDADAQARVLRYLCSRYTERTFLGPGVGIYAD